MLFFVMKYCWLELPYLYLTATNNKEFTSSLTSFCGESKKKLGWSIIFHKLKSVVKAKSAQTNSPVSEGGITVKPGQDSIHELIILKVNLFVASGVFLNVAGRDSRVEIAGAGAGKGRRCGCGLGSRVNINHQI